MSAARAAAVLCVAAALAGCGLLAPAPEAPREALIDALPSDLPQAPRRAGVLRVAEPQSRPLLDTLQMAYSLAPHQVAWYARNEWAEPPAQMLQPLLVRTLERTGCCSAVVTANHAAPVAFELHAELLDLVQDFSQEPGTLRLALRMRLLALPSGRLLAVREIVVRQPIRARTPEAGVAAANEATQQVLREVAEVVLAGVAPP